MTKYLFVDANHLCHRCAHVHKELIYEDTPVGMMYGVYKSLVKAKRDFPLHHIVLAWDAGHYRRDKESAEGVKKKIVPETYKENRIKNKDDLVRWQMDQQWDILRASLEHTCFQQVIKKGFEADDVICSYVLTCDSPCIILSSDKDYYQLLEPGVLLIDPIHFKDMSIKDLTAEYGLTDPLQWVSVGALAGDTGDNIFGVPGVGDGTGCKLIAKHKSLEQLYKHLKKEKSEGKELPKRHLAILEYEERVKLAYSLKQMDIIEDIEPLASQTGDSESLIEFFEKYAFDSLLKSVDNLVG